MNSKTLIEQRNALVNQAGTIMQGDKIDSAQREAFDRIMAEVDVLNGDIERLERSEAFAAEQRSATRPPRSQPGDVTGPVDAAKSKRAFRDWMRTGTISSENRSYLQTVETRDLGVGVIAAPITGGNVLVPTGFDPQLNIAQKSFGAIVGAVRNFKTSGGGPLKVALSDDTTAMFNINPEVTAATTTDPNLSGFTSYTDTITTMLKVSNQLLQDSEFDVDDFIQNVFAARYYRTLAANIAQGNGSNIQKLTPTAVITAATGGANTVTLNNLIDVYAALDPAYVEQSNWIMTSTTRAALMKLTDSYGRPLLQTDLLGQPFNALFGRSIVISQGTDQLGANKTPILFGDVAASYTLRIAGGLSIARSVDRFFELQELAVLGAARVGGYNTSQAASSSLVGFKNSAN